MNDVFIKTDTQRAMLTKLNQLTRKFQEREPELDQLGSFPYENIQNLKDIGYTSLSIAKEYGGEEISLYDFLLFQEKIAEGDGSTALSVGWHVGIMLELTENPRWESKLFAQICSEVKKGALLNRCATERNTGSPTRGGKPETTAYEGESTWVLNGQKTFTTMSYILDYFLVSATIQGSEEVGEFLVPCSAKGTRIEETWDSVALRGTASHDLVMQNVEIPKEYLVEIRNNGKKNNHGWLLHIPACYLGISQAARNYALHFAKAYKPNSVNEPIYTLPNVQRLIGEMELELLQARHFMYSVAEKYDACDEPHELQAELSAVKYTATNAAISIIDKAMRIVGARSLSEKNPLHRYYLHVRAGLHNPPMDDITLTQLAYKAIENVK
ncbi:acyl-CoA dehydrogenase family protein [Bacillus sp. 165]|uniref:acyl-CoA dehydrogenase family protein n=1 Tax=Bacillus sp. 165 TaxID=1529117 RepID=UPI001ADB2984|nr:acyl-CoA/acyl-ACP dehydrogenase [Bacillus sp. 165]